MTHQRQNYGIEWRDGRRVDGNLVVCQSPHISGQLLQENSDCLLFEVSRLASECWGPTQLKSLFL